MSDVLRYFRTMKRAVMHTRQARKDRRSIPQDVLERIDRAIAVYAADPQAARNVKKLRGQPRQFRIRVGDWRVIIEDDGRTLRVLAIRPRGSAYKP